MVLCVCGGVCSPCSGSFLLPIDVRLPLLWSVSLEFCCIYPVRPVSFGELLACDRSWGCIVHVKHESLSGSGPRELGVVEGN